jgi:hypothetical protein
LSPRFQTQVTALRHLFQGEPVQDRTG